jgi:hypothetical protein
MALLLVARTTETSLITQFMCVRSMQRVGILDVEQWERRGFMFPYATITAHSANSDDRAPIEVSPIPVELPKRHTNLLPSRVCYLQGCLSK